MNILFISNLYYPHIFGGAERVVQSIAEGLVLRGHDCHVVTLGKGGGRVDRDVNGVHVCELPVCNLYWPFQSPRPGVFQRALWHAVDTFNPLMQRVFGELLDEINPDVVNSHNIAGFSVAAWSSVKQRNIPLVHTMHDQYLLCPNSTMFKNGRNCERPCLSCRVYSAPRIERSNLPDFVTGVSQFILERHAKFGCFSSVSQRVIYNAYERLPDDNDTSIHRNQNAPLRFGFLGRLHESKGIECLLDAYLDLPKGEAELWVGGTGDEAFVGRLKHKSSHRPDVHWLGFIKPESLLGQVDVMVIPSLWHDTAPLVALESLAWGLPLLVSNRGGLPELAPPEVGWSFDPEDAQGLSRLMRICVEQRLLVAEKSISALRIAQRFSFEAMLNDYIEVYTGVLRESS